ncbi:hypothetical protein D3C71_1788250 [compost metagenome]
MSLYWLTLRQMVSSSWNRVRSGSWTGCLLLSCSSAWVQRRIGRSRKRWKAYSMPRVMAPSSSMVSRP